MRSLAKHRLFRISCQQASRLLSKRQDEPLPFAKGARLRLHLAYCRACTNVSRQFEALRQAMRAIGERE